MEFRKQVLDRLISELQPMEGVLAVWEGGSAANATTDQYSDIDLCIMGRDGVDAVFDKVAETLNSISKITHVWNEPKSIWPDLTQKVYFLEDAPKHFFVDVALFPEDANGILAEFMQTERHGQPVVHFDKVDLIVSRPLDKTAIFEKQKKRLQEIVGAFPIYRTEVYKELDRGNNADAIAFYQGGMLKPYVEVLGMVHRPYHFDFGFRYLKRSFPTEIYSFIEKCMYVRSTDELKANADKTDQLFYKAVDEAKIRLKMND